MILDNLRTYDQVEHSVQIGNPAMGDRQLHSSRVQLCTNGNASTRIAAFENGFLRMQEKGAQHILELSSVRRRSWQLRREVQNYCDVPLMAVISPRIGQFP